MHRALIALSLTVACAPAALAEIRSAEACAEAVAADAAAAREAAAAWATLGGGTEAEVCEAVALEAMGATGAAAEILTRVAGNPNRALPLALRLTLYEDAARLWLEDGRDDLADAVLDNLDRIAPPTGARLTLRARAAGARADWAGAAASLAAVIDADPDDAGARALRAAALRLGGDPAAARIEAEAALARAPDLPEALFEAAAAAAELGDSVAAGTLWLRLVEAHPDAPLATLARRNIAAMAAVGTE